MSKSYESQKDHSKVQEEEWKKFEGDLEILLKLPQGRSVFWRIMSDCSVFHSTFTGNSSTYFNEGKRAIGLMIFNSILNVRPSAYQEMIIENREKKNV